MKNFSLTLQSANEISSYIAEDHLCSHELEIINEMLVAIENSDTKSLEYFNQFGETLRHIHMNVHAHREGLKFGFTEIAFDRYGWLKRPCFLETEKLAFGVTAGYNQPSSLTIGMGPNGKWTYSLNYSFGTAGGGWALSVFDKPYTCRSGALTAGLNDLKNRFTAVLGNIDTTNYKQPLITKTLADIAAYQHAQVQLSLF